MQTIHLRKTEVLGETRALNSDVGLEDLDKLEAKAQAEFTNKATSCEMNKIADKWSDKRDLKFDFNCVTPV